MALSETLNEPLDPFAAIGRVARGNDIQGRSALARKELEPLMREEATARKELKLGETRLKREKAQAETAAEEGFATGKKQAYEEYQAGLAERPTFNPSDFDAASGAQLAGLTAVLGMISGRSSARAALKSMAGFTKGAREGRADLYDREAKQFEQDLKAWKDNAVLAKEKLTQIIDLLGTDRNAALIKAKELEPTLDEGLAKTYLRMQNPQKALEVINNAIKAGDQAEAEYAKATNKGGLKPGVVATDRFSIRVKLKKISDRMKESLSNQNFREKLDKYRIDLFFQEQSPYLDQLLQTNIPEDIRSFAILAKTFRNQKYREESGLAVTSYEQLRQYGAVPQPGDSSKTLQDKLKTLDIGLLDDIETDMKVYPQLTSVGQTLGYSTDRPRISTQQTEESVQIPTPQTEKEFNDLAPGSLYRDPDDNQIYRKPKEVK